MSQATDDVTKAWKDHWENSDSRGDESLRGKILKWYIYLVGGFSSQRHLDGEVRKILGDVRGKKVLDAGCGTGLGSLALSRQGADVTLLDIAPLALKIASEFYESFHLKATYIEGSIFEMPFPDQSFDIVWNTGVIEHFEPDVRKAAVQEMLRVLKPDGIFLTINPSAAAPVYRYAKARGEELGTWDVGVELPIETLATDIDGQKFALTEFRQGWLMQFHFLKYVVPRPLRLPFAIFHEVVQTGLNFLNRFPGYAIFSVIRRR